MQFPSCRFGKMTTLSLTNCHLANPHSVTISEWQEGNRSFWSTAGMPHHTAVIETLPPDDDDAPSHDVAPEQVLDEGDGIYPAKITAPDVAGFYAVMAAVNGGEAALLGVVEIE